MSAPFSKEAQLTRSRRITPRQVQTQAANKRKADVLFSQLIRSKNHCEFCGSQRFLQCAHWISRRYTWTRTYEENAFCLCAACHRMFTDHPTEFGIWAIEQRGIFVYEQVKERSLRREKFDWAAELERLRLLVEIDK